MMGAIRYPCPTCGQPAGERCRDENDHLLVEFHFARLELAEGGDGPLDEEDEE